jgi:hypothetical protein
VDILDCNAAVFKAFLDYIYSGTIHLDGVENIAALVEFSTKWAPDHQHYITKICSPSHNVFLDTADDILNRLQDDLLKLINNEQNSDVTLILGEAENQELVYGHRFILCRAQLFKSMFLSGMQETYSNRRTVIGCENVCPTSESGFKRVTCTEAPLFEHLF